MTVTSDEVAEAATVVARVSRTQGVDTAATDARPGLRQQEERLQSVLNAVERVLFSQPGNWSNRTMIRSSYCRSWCGTTRGIDGASTRSRARTIRATRRSPFS